MFVLSTGAVFAAVAETRFVRMGLQNMFVETDHSSLLESRGCALAFKACAVKHLAACIEVLEEVLKGVCVCVRVCVYMCVYVYRCTYI